MQYSNQQNKIIKHRNKHALVVACPGSGKTTTMIAFLLDLLDEGFSEKDLLVLMFNKSAKIDFSKKMLLRSNGRFRQMPDVKTFHSLAYSIIANLESKGLMVKRNLNSSNKYMEKIAMDACIRTIGQEKFKNIQNKQTKVLDFFVQYLSLVKANIFLSPREAYNNLQLEKEYDFFVEAFEHFEEMRKGKKIRFFDDLLYDLAIIIRDNESVRNWLGNRKKYVVIDEYQDTNITQTVILKAIVGSTGCCVAVGDIDQCLYEFRGAHPDVMTKGFEHDFPNHTRYKLSYSYRYGKKIALLSNSLILKNKNRFDQITISHPNNYDTQPILIGTSNYGQTTVEIIDKKISEGFKKSDIMVLVRLFSQSTALELSLLKMGHKVNIEGGVSSLYSREMDAVCSLFEISTGVFKKHNHELRKQKWESLLKFPHIGINADAMQLLIEKLCSRDFGYGSAISGFTHPSIHKYQISKLKERGLLLTLFEKQLEKTKKADSFTLLDKYISDTDLEAGLAFTCMTDMEYSESCDRLEAILAFIKANNSNPDVFLKLIEDYKNAKASANYTLDCITITSIHRSKGLEWPVVIISGLEAGKFPYEPKKSMTIGNHEEGERRLLYVAITRGINEVYMLVPDSYAFKEYIKDGTNKSQIFSINDEPSKFIFETDFYRLSHYDFGNVSNNLPLIKRYDVDFAECA